MADINPVLMMVGLASLGLAPFFLMMVTSYVKIVVVTSLIRNALGVQQIPPTMALNGLAIIFTLFIMMPVGNNMLKLLEKEEIPEKPGIAEAVTILQNVSSPLREFLTINTEQNVLRVFMSTAEKVWPQDQHEYIEKENFFILIPAFTITELTKAFQIGFLLYLPFVAIDLIISNILLAMGMMMVSPMTISLPFKLLLFVFLEGWLKLSQGLLLSYNSIGTL